MQGTGPVEEWVLLKNGLLFAVILSFCFLSCGDRPFGRATKSGVEPQEEWKNLLLCSWIFWEAYGGDDIGLRYEDVS